MILGLKKIEFDAILQNLIPQNFFNSHTTSQKIVSHKSLIAKSIFVFFCRENYSTPPKKINPNKVESVHHGFIVKNVKV